MITATILTFFSGGVFIFLSPILLLADVSPNSPLVSSIATANGYIFAVPFHLFIISVLSTLVFILLFEAGYWTFKGIRFLYRKIPGIS